jgi:hypothetical protein
MSGGHDTLLSPTASLLLYMSFSAMQKCIQHIRSVLPKRERTHKHPLLMDAAQLDKHNAGKKKAIKEMSDKKKRELASVFEEGWEACRESSKSQHAHANTQPCIVDRAVIPDKYKVLENGADKGAVSQSDHGKR